MLSKFIILALIHLKYRCAAYEYAVYTYQANAVSEAAEQITVYWNGDKLIGGQTFEVLTMPADVAPVTTDQQFVVIDNLDASKSYEFTVFLIKNHMKTPIAYTRSQVLPKGSSPTCQGRCDGRYIYGVTAHTEGSGKVYLHWMEGYTVITQEERFLITTSPPDVPKIILNKNLLVVDNLKPETTYTFSVYLRGENGILKTPSADATIKTLPPDENNPTELIAVVYGHNRIDLEWKAAENAHCAVHAYTVQCTSHPGILYTTEKTRYAILNLHPKTSYTFAVHSTKADGTFYPGAPVVGATTYSKNTFNPRDVTAESLSPTSIRLRWTAAAESDRFPKLYKILTNVDKNHALETDLTTIDIHNLSPSTEYIFTVHSTSLLDFWYTPGAEVETKTLAEDAK